MFEGDQDLINDIKHLMETVLGVGEGFDYYGLGVVSTTKGNEIKAYRETKEE